MSEPTLEAIRARLELLGTFQLATDCRALVAEVERLRTENGHLRTALTRLDAYEAIAEKERENRRLREALERIAVPCRCVWGDYPKGTSCLDVIEEARSNPTGYDDEYRARLLAGVHCCTPCIAHAALHPQEQSGFAPEGPIRAD